MAVDALLGDLIEALESRGLYEDAALFVTSDHGENLGEHGLIEHQFSVHETVLGAIAMGCGKVVTVAMDEVVFHQPVRVGDLVSFYADVVKTGRTSLKVRVEVEAFRRRDGRTVPVTQADVTYVHIDDDGKPTPLP